VKAITTAATSSHYTRVFYPGTLILCPLPPAEYTSERDQRVPGKRTSQDTNQNVSDTGPRRLGSGMAGHLLVPVSARLFVVCLEMNLRCLLVALVAVFAESTTPCFADVLQLILTNPTVLEERLRAGEVLPRERQNLATHLFQQVGCQATLQQIGRRSSNVICSLPGETSATIVVGAHFDFAEKGQGIVDDWTGVTLLVSLYETLKTLRQKHSYEFVAFAGEEQGLLGSSHYVEVLSREQESRLQAFINLECLGLTPPKVWVHRSTPLLVKRLAEIATTVHVPVSGIDIDAVGDDDTHPFLSKRIPVISIHSVTQETLPILHSSHDNIGAVHPGDYYDAYRLVAFYLKYLDARLSFKRIVSLARMMPRSGRNILEINPKELSGSDPCSLSSTSGNCVASISSCEGRKQ
jgi:hypothetical protein